MARLHVALLLLFIAISAVIVSPADNDKPPSTTTASAPTATTPTDGIGGDVVEGPADDNAIGTTDNDDAAVTPDDAAGDDEVAVAGPIGSDSSYANYPPPQQEASGSGATVAFGFVSVVGAMAGSLFFF
ncbi:unnamed protein product [Arabidopsis lyrata]|uniref:Anther-specific protein BCP1 n=1 Tax=Arabidopsis lyrata subsp. lyrata TaxID=81972 RepID=D7LQZ1_ARALL|nr:anther-specific protein BCP1 [Arabidopsis lyrata subsp. lyrata]EFH51567.1 hypothetical protein ARALYDRAFT_484375 [Arabidopsis lyrata subsp. lyrata]CAH8266771.1 unnamed protein product [Arabidopsis lyrata]|eukprot:XP_020882432.1 anther-specific protein BCP1 [Arabidopsis lyrata subsp. lyrata]